MHSESSGYISAGWFSEVALKINWSLARAFNATAACKLFHEPGLFIFCGFVNDQLALWHASPIKKIDCIVFSTNKRWNPFERSMRTTPPTGDNTIKSALDYAGFSLRRLQKALLILMDNYSWTTTKSFCAWNANSFSSLLIIRIFFSSRRIWRNDARFLPLLRLFASFDFTRAYVDFECLDPCQYLTFLKELNWSRFL